MAIQSKKQKLNFRYTMIVIMFLLAGFCQYFDSRVPEACALSLSFIANCLFFFILISWYISIRERIVEKKIRNYLSLVALLLLFLMVVRFVKYNTFIEYGFIARLLWYMYYIPECLAPVLMFLIALQIDRKKNNEINKYWHILFIPAIIFIVLIMTNDFHQLCFKFKPGFEDFTFDYKHGILLYIILGFNFTNGLIASIILFHKCRVSAVRKKIWIPITFLVSTCILLAFAFIFDFDSFKVPDLFCLIVISLTESLIYIGFIPSNTNYKRYFFLSNTNALITDSKLNIYAYSYNSEDIISERLDLLRREEVVVYKDLRYRSKPISGGNVFWIENLAQINYLNNEIQDIMNQLSGENDLLKAKNKLKEEKAKIDEQHKLYQIIDKATKKQVTQARQLISNKNSETSDKNLKLACIYTAYIKRRSNLLILHEKDNMVHIDELTFAIKESITYLSLYGVSCSLIPLKKDKVLDIEIIEIIYDFFEECIEKALPSLNGLIVKFTEKNNRLTLRICLDTSNGFIDQNWNKEKLEKHHGHIELFTQSEDDEKYVKLIMEVE